MSNNESVFSRNEVAAIAVVLGGFCGILLLVNVEHVELGPEYICKNETVMARGWDDQGEQDYQPIFIDGDYAKCGGDQ